MAADDPAHPFDATGEREPSFKNARTLGMLLFLAALFMLFAASLIGYAITRQRNKAAGEVHLPALLWLSTLFVIGVSVFIARANRQIKQGLLHSYRKSLIAALALAAGFVTLQTPAMIGLLRQHNQFRAAGIHLYGLLFALVLLHALHVVGGLFNLISVTLAAQRGEFSATRHDPLRYTAMYWHFLDAVWIVMFATFLILG